LAIVLALPASVSAISPARAQDASTILKSMSDYVASQKVISAKYDSSIEVITPTLEKIQFASSGQLLLSRPDKLRVTRTGGYADLEFVFDGKTATLLGKNINAFAQFDTPGSVDQLVDRLRNQLSVELPGADLLLTNAYDVLMSDVIDAKHIGQGGHRWCRVRASRLSKSGHRLAGLGGSRLSSDTAQFVITSKAVTGGPQYTLLIKDWKTDAQPGAEAFVFKPPADAKEIDFKALSEIDEVPPGVVAGGKK
jgi:hypothetical protein